MKKYFGDIISAFVFALTVGIVLIYASYIFGGPIRVGNFQRVAPIATDEDADRIFAAQHNIPQPEFTDN
jgi:hypothetical protein